MNLLVILGTVRPGRVSERLAKWVAAEAATMPDTKVEIADLKDYPMDFFDEPASPRYNPDRKPTPVVQRWMAKMATPDAYIFVTPEYNHSIPGVLKNSLDYITTEMYKKPVSVVSHGSVGGARAAMHLREILAESGGVNITRQVALAGARDKLNEAGELSAEEKAIPHGPQTALKNMLEELKWHSDLMAAGRANDQS
jgi:NAD(P)H-dependent FMN reductase